MATAKKKTSVSKSARPSERSLTRSSDSPSFFTLRITQQSIYWLILCLFILGLGVWVLTLNMKVQKIYDHADHTTSNSDHRLPPADSMPR